MAKIIVIGSGILGSAAAYTLSKGRKVLLIERDFSEPDRIVGELLQPGGIQALHELNMEECIKEIDGIRVDGYVIFKSKEDQVKLKYPGEKEEGISFHHGKFIMRLREKARSSINVTCLEGNCVDLIKCPVTDRYIGVVAKPKISGVKTSYYAPLTIIADGCFSSFRKTFVSKATISKSNFVGLLLKNCALPHPNYGHVILAQPCPILLYQIGTSDTRMLVDIPNPMPKISNGDMNTYLEEQIGPQLPESVQPSFYEALKIERIRSMPCSWLPATKNDTEGAIILGDAQNMRHPLTGGGMTVALWDVVHLRDILSTQTDLTRADLVMTALEELHWRRKKLSTVVNILANALYELFSAGNDLHVLELQRACFEYFKLGGRCVSTPVGLLAGIIPEPMTLMGHFFAVAVYGILLICGESLWRLPQNIHKSTMVLWKACGIFFPLLISEMI